MGMGELDVLIGNIQADAKRIRLLDILGQQLGLLITGKPDLESLLSLLKAEALVSEEDCGNLKLTFALETVRPLTYRSYRLILMNSFNIGSNANWFIGHRH
jgi:hypothetical protein